MFIQKSIFIFVAYHLRQIETIETSTFISVSSDSPHHGLVDFISSVINLTTLGK